MPWQWGCVWDYLSLGKDYAETYIIQRHGFCMVQNKLLLISMDWVFLGVGLGWVSCRNVFSLGLAIRIRTMRCVLYKYSGAYMYPLSLCADSRVNNILDEIVLLEYTVRKLDSSCS